MRLGICFGGYSPLHQGHMDIIMRAKKECDATLVIVCGFDGDPRGNVISLEKRFNIIRNFLTDDTVKVGMINDSDLGLDESMCPENWQVWLQEVYNIKDKLIKPPANDMSWHDTFIFYVGEKRYVGDIRNVVNKTMFSFGEVDIVYVDRSENPVSGTDCRTLPIKNWNKITQPFRSYYSHNILVAGTASEGKTTLVHDIGKYFNIPYSYEKGRDLCHLKTDTEFNFKDFMYNLTAQNDYNESLIASPQNPGVFISDTDNMVTLMYAYAYRNRPGFSIDQADYDALFAVAERYRKNIKWDKIFLLKPSKQDITDDGERYMPDSDYAIRKAFYENLKKFYDDFGYVYEELDGRDYYKNFLTVRNYIRGIGFDN